MHYVSNGFEREKKSSAPHKVGQNTPNVCCGLQMIEEICVLSVDDETNHNAEMRMKKYLFALTKQLHEDGPQPNLWTSHSTLFHVGSFNATTEESAFKIGSRS